MPLYLKSLKQYVFQFHYFLMSSDVNPNRFYNFDISACVYMTEDIYVSCCCTLDFMLSTLFESFLYAVEK